MALRLNKFSLHHAIMRHFVDCGFAPTTEALAITFGTNSEKLAQALCDLQDYHGVVLHPHCPEVWVIHPFSTAPTCFVVRNAERLWWANCAWCSLGIAALLGGNDISIGTKLGADGEPVTVHVDNGHVRENLLVHFPIPMTAVWDNVIYADSTVLVFDSEAAIDEWTERHKITRGDVQPIQRVYELAVAWFGRYLDQDWRKWTMTEARGIFRKVGLSGPIWDLPETTERF